MSYTTTTEKQTFNLGKALAKNLNGGETILLQGNLGSGKTILTKGIAAGLNIKKTITSPTFVLFKVYPVKKHRTIKRLVHADCYRLTDGQAILDAGLEEYIGNKDTLVIIEWGEKIKTIIPTKTIKIIFKQRGKIRTLNISC
ncbi:MAG: tRNA (adenosine(37)-N6)-threonylcarbamoyltransferase complex ATPase subunit type 1 TsaE [Patescibacteria group bacterium]|jgi:tRNA threonylcarbamoyladenosine biosynthesis protein TsaE